MPALEEVVWILVLQTTHVAQQQHVQFQIINLYVHVHLEQKETHTKNVKLVSGDFGLLRLLV